MVDRPRLSLWVFDAVYNCEGRPVAEARYCRARIVRVLSFRIGVTNGFCAFLAAAALVQANTAQDKAGDYTQAAKEKASDLTGSTKDSAGATQGKAGDYAQAAKDKASGAADTLGSKVIFSNLAVIWPTRSGCVLARLITTVIVPSRQLAK